jgi:RNA polymerase sigma-70 factor (ECF subfamily)
MNAVPVKVRPPGGSNPGRASVRVQTNVSTLVDRCVAGEAEAWRELHRSYHPLVRTFLRRLGVAAVELDDTCQEVFVQMFRSLPGFERRAELKTWVYRLCVTHAGRLRRRRAVQKGLAWLRLAPPPPAPEAGLVWSEGEAGRRVAEALAAMKPLSREVLVLYELEGLSGDEIGRVLGCPVATVWRRLHYARGEFSALVLGQEGQDARSGETP